MLDWTRYFDQIYCIHYLPNKARRIALEKELKRVGIFDSGIFQYQFSYDTPFDRCILSHVTPHHREFTDQRSKGSTSLVLANYYLFKKAVALNHDRILLLQDDVIFVNNLEIVSRYLDHLPNDYDVVQLDRINPNNYLQRGMVPGLYYNADYVGGFYSNACTALSKKAMQVGIDILEHDFFVDDCLFINTDDSRPQQLKRYAITHNIAKQAGRDYDHFYRGVIDFGDFYPRKEK